MYTCKQESKGGKTCVFDRKQGGYFLKHLLLFYCRRISRRRWWASGTKVGVELLSRPCPICRTFQRIRSAWVAFSSRFGGPDAGSLRHEYLKAVVFRYPIAMLRSSILQNHTLSFLICVSKSYESETQLLLPEMNVGDAKKTRLKHSATDSPGLSSRLRLQIITRGQNRGNEDVKDPSYQNRSRYKIIYWAEHWIILTFQYTVLLLYRSVNMLAGVGHCTLYVWRPGCNSWLVYLWPNCFERTAYPKQVLGLATSALPRHTIEDVLERYSQTFNFQRLAQISPLNHQICEAASTSHSLNMPKLLHSYRSKLNAIYWLESFQGALPKYLSNSHRLPITH